MMTNTMLVTFLVIVGLNFGCHAAGVRAKPQENRDGNLFLVDPNHVRPDEPFEAVEMSGVGEFGDLAMSDDNDLPPSVFEMANTTKSDDQNLLIGSVHSMVSVVSLLLNVLVIAITFAGSDKFFRPTQSFLIQQLSFSSMLLVLTMIASAIHRLAANWLLGWFGCKLNNCLKACGMTSQAYFCTLLCVELFLQLRDSSFNRMIASKRTRVKLLLVFVGWCMALVMSYPFWSRSTYYTMNGQSECTINTYDSDDSGFNVEDLVEVVNGQVIFNDTNMDLDDLVYIDEEYMYEDSVPNQYECHLSDTSYSFRFWFGSLVTFAYFVPLVIIVALFVASKLTKASQKNCSDSDKRHAKWTWLIALTFLVCWTPSSVFKAGKLHGLPFDSHQCRLAQDVGSIMGYLSCLALPAVVLVYLVNVRRCKELSVDEKVPIDEEATLCEDVTNRSDETDKCDWD